MAYFLGRDVDVFVTLESAAADLCIGLEAQLDSAGYPTVGMIATGTTAPGGNVFANGMNSVANVSGSRVIDLTGVDLSISSTDEDVGPFIGQVSTQSVELRKEHVITLTRKKSDECWDSVFNGPASIADFEGSTALASMAGGSGQPNLTGALAQIQKCKVGDYIGGIAGIPYGTQIVSLSEAGASSVIEMSANTTATISSAAPVVNSMPTFLRQGARFGIMYDGSTARVAMGRKNPKHVTSGTSFEMNTDTVYYGYRVHIRMKDAAEVYTVRNAAITGHTVTLNADGVSEETLELSTTVPAILYTGATNTFYETLSKAGEL